MAKPKGTKLYQCSAGMRGKKKDGVFPVPIKLVRAHFSDTEVLKTFVGAMLDVEISADPIGDADVKGQESAVDTSLTVCAKVSCGRVSFSPKEISLTLAFNGHGAALDRIDGCTWSMTVLRTESKVDDEQALLAKMEEK